MVRQERKKKSFPQGHRKSLYEKTMLTSLSVELQIAIYPLAVQKVHFSVFPSFPRFMGFLAIPLGHRLMKLSVYNYGFSPLISVVGCTQPTFGRMKRTLGIVL